MFLEPTGGRTKPVQARPFANNSTECMVTPWTPDGKAVGVDPRKNRDRRILDGKIAGLGRGWRWGDKDRGRSLGT